MGESDMFYNACTQRKKNRNCAGTVIVHRDGHAVGIEGKEGAYGDGTCM